MRALQEAERDREQRRQDREQEPAAAQVQRIEELASDFAQVWEALETAPVDRKRLLGRLEEDVTLTRDGYEVAVALRLRGGKALALDPVALPKPRHLQFPLDRVASAALAEALEAHTDAEAASRTRCSMSTACASVRASRANCNAAGSSCASRGT